jgi:N-acetyl-gamma-glutamyl-phosphate reductase
MKIDAVILGASGYGGGELLYWLSRHPNVASIRGSSRHLAGRPFADAHPNLRGVVDGRFESDPAWSELAETEQPVVFSALPHGELAKRLRELEAAWSEAGLTDRLLLIDLSGDFRIPDPVAFEKTNHTPHPCPEFLSRFVYGLPEWNRDSIRSANRIASPGCFATALQLALLPLRGLKIGFMAANAVTGSSGSGAFPSATTHHPTRANDFHAYKVLGHRHLAEVRMMIAACDIKGTLAFVPYSGPFVRGIYATIQFAMPGDLDASELRARVIETFTAHPFVRTVEESPHVGAVTGSNFADLAIVTNETSAAIMVAIDNLGKGMAGQAVQSMNVALGLPETTALWTVGRFPT